VERLTAGEIATSVFRQLGETTTLGKKLRYVAISSKREVRWLLPSRGAKAGPVLANWAPYRWRSRIGWRAVRAADRVGWAHELPGSVELELDEVRGAKWASLGWQGHDVPIPVIYIGTPGPQRKAVVHLVGRESAACRVVVKVSLAEEAKAAILHEAEVLKALERERYEHSPRLLHVNPERGITAQTFVQGRPGGKKFASEYWWLLRSLMLPGESTSLSAAIAEWQREAGSYAWVIEELRDDTPLPTCWEHGDFAPWNIRQLAGGDCALLDWEHARRPSLPLMDAFHFLHMQDLLFGERPRLHWQRLWDGAMEMGIAPGSVRRLEIAYLVRAAIECRRKQNEARLRFIQGTLELIRRKAA